jgi:hypothetical protein
VDWVKDKDQRWPGHPPLLQDESFSSWFARTARANGLRPAEFFRAIQPGEDHNPPDLDRHADDHLIERMAIGTGIDAGKLKQATFSGWAGRLFEADDGVCKLHWLAPAGRHGGKRCFGQQFCPECLASDPEPYLRLPWRLAFLATCPVHGRLLLDRCQVCQEPFSVLRQDNRLGIVCGSCGADLRTFLADAPLFEAARVQQALLGRLADGWWPLGDYGDVYAVAAFEILAILTRLLAGGTHAYALRERIGRDAPNLAVPPSAVPRAREGALLGPRARNVLIPMACRLMEDWPYRFVAAAKSVGLSSRALLKRSRDLYPFAYADAVDRFLTDAAVGPADEEVAAVKAVLRNRGEHPGRRNLVALCGSKSAALDRLAEPVAAGAAWGKGRYWKLDGVSPEVKEAARIAAHRAGDDVGPWLDALLRRYLNLPSAREKPPIG